MSDYGIAMQTENGLVEVVKPKIDERVTALERKIGTIGDGLESQGGYLKVKIGEGLKFNEERAITIDPDNIPSGIPIGFFADFGGKTPPNGWLIRNGAEVLIETYPKLFEVIGTTYGGNGVTTFKLPDSIGKYIRGGNSEEVGTAVEAGLPNISGQFDISGTVLVNGLNTPKIFTRDVPNNSFVPADDDATSKAYIATGVQYGNWKSKDRAFFDASLSNSIYGNSDTVTPPSLIALPCIKAFDSLVESENVTTENLAAEIAKLEPMVVKSTIIYPNGGSAGNEANTTINQRIVMDNPFSGYFVQCIVQIKVKGIWGNAGWGVTYDPSTGNVSRGCSASQSLPSDKIIFISGSSQVSSRSPYTGAPWVLDDESEILASPPCRVIVTRLGKI